MGKPPQPGAPVHPAQIPEDLDLLEQTVSLEGPLPGRRDAYGLEPLEIPLDWVLEGEPRAREKPLASSTDGAAAAFMWDCTSGRFQWEYAAEQIVHIVQGCAMVEIAGVSRRLQAGDTHVFPGGSTFRWNVPDYVRAVGFRLRAPAAGTLGRRIQEALAASWRARRTRPD
ncbi:MAG: cupin domain-containing protein [Pseudomonadota bacterium]|nr:cupin domain-containing protein [Pseudomonadota bacterium]